MSTGEKTEGPLANRPGDTSREFEGCACPTRLVNEGGVTYIEFAVDAVGVRFDAGWIPKESMEWLALVLSGELVGLRMRAVDRTKRRVREAFGEFVGSFDYRG